MMEIESTPPPPYCYYCYCCHCYNCCAVSKLLRLAGMIGMTFSNPAFCLLAMNYASPSILAPFSGLTLVWIVLFSHPVIGEKPSQKQVVAASLIIAGEVLTAIFGDHTNDEGVTVQDVVRTLWQPLVVTLARVSESFLDALGSCVPIPLSHTYMLLLRFYLLGSTRNTLTPKRHSFCIWLD